MIIAIFMKLFLKVSNCAHPEHVEGYLRALEEYPSTGSGRARKNLMFFLIISAMHISFTLPLNILHLSFHQGCLREIETIAKLLNVQVTSLFVPDIAPQEFDGYSSGNVLYNIGHERAQCIWNKHKDYFNQFDAIITSDTAPLARIFLQNDYEKPLIIWVCNRFDYTDYGNLDCDFPDAEFYHLFQEAHHRENVFLIPYTAFEPFYAAQKGIIFNHSILKPSGTVIAQDNSSAIPSHVDKSETFFIPPYLNDTFLAEKCTQLGLTIYKDRYNGPQDLKDFKGIIHIPYAWSNIAFFENIQNGVPYFVPSVTFMLHNLEKGTIWWQNDNYFKKNYHCAEWYNNEHREIITYFDSWEDLKNKIEMTDFDLLRTKIKNYAQEHCNRTLNQWKNIFEHIMHNA